MKIEMDQNASNAIMAVALAAVVIVLFMAMGGAFK